MAVIEGYDEVDALLMSQSHPLSSRLVEEHMKPSDDGLTKRGGAVRREMANPAKLAGTGVGSKLVLKEASKVASVSDVKSKPAPEVKVEKAREVKVEKAREVKVEKAREVKVEKAREVKTCEGKCWFLYYFHCIICKNYSGCSYLDYAQ